MFKIQKNSTKGFFLPAEDKENNISDISKYKNTAFQSIQLVVFFGKAENKEQDGGKQANGHIRVDHGIKGERSYGGT